VQVVDHPPGRDRGPAWAWGKAAVWVWAVAWGTVWAWGEALVWEWVAAWADGPTALLHQDSVPAPRPMLDKAASAIVLVALLQPRIQLLLAVLEVRASRVAVARVSR